MIERIPRWRRPQTSGFLLHLHRFGDLIFIAGQVLWNADRPNPLLLCRSAEACPGPIRSILESRGVPWNRFSK